MRTGLEKEVNKSKDTLSGITSEKNTRTFFIIASSLLFIFAVFLLFITIKKTGVFNSAPEETKAQNVQQLIQVEVLNGCGVAGVGDAFTDLLRNKGIDVVKTGNYRSFSVDNTFIIDRMDKIETAFKVADSLNLNKQLILTEINKSLFIDLTIVIGKDFPKYFQLSGS